MQPLQWAGLLGGPVARGLARFCKAILQRSGPHANCIPTVCLMRYTLQLTEFPQPSCITGSMMIPTFCRRKPKLREANRLVHGHATRGWWSETRSLVCLS